MVFCSSRKSCCAPLHVLHLNSLSSDQVASNLEGSSCAEPASWHRGVPGLAAHSWACVSLGAHRVESRSLRLKLQQHMEVQNQTANDCLQ